MTQLDDITVRVLAEDLASKVLEQVRKEMERTGNEGKKTAGGLDILGASFKSLAIAAAGFLTVSSVVEFFKSSAQEAISAERANARFETTLRDVAGATEEEILQLRELATELQRTTTFTDDEIVSAQALLATYKLTPAEIERVTPALLDMAAAMERSTGQAPGLEKVAKLFGEQVEQAGQLAPVLADIQTRYKGIAEATGKTTAGQLSILNNEWNDMKEDIGKELLPVLLEFGRTILENKDDIKELATTLIDLADALLPLVQIFGPVINSLADMSRANKLLQEDLEENGRTLDNFMDSFLLAIPVINLFAADMMVAADAASKPITPEVDQSRVKKLEALGETVRSIAQALEDLDQRFLANSGDQTSQRLALLKNELEQLGPGQKLNVDESLQNTLQFDTLQQTQDFLRQQGVQQQGGVDREVGLASVEFAERQRDLTNEQIDLTGQLRAAREEGEAIVREHTALLQTAATATAAEKESVNASFEFIKTEGPLVNEVLRTGADAYERRADAAEREADALERTLEAAEALSELQA